jgi:DNA-binding CsgD family transcriptional regulator
MPPPERRDQPRRALDRAADDLHKALRSCLDCVADGVLLLDSEKRVVYATPPVHQILTRKNPPFAILPKFTLHSPGHAVRFTAFTNGKSQESGPLSLLLDGENGHEPLLITCFHLPKPSETDLQSVRYLVTLRDPNRYATQQWQVFIRQFALTQAEGRLCRALVDGLTINDYCEKWKVAASTARSQLRSVFDKTSTRRQSDLLRLIFLFTRS